MARYIIYYFCRFLSLSLIFSDHSSCLLYGWFMNIPTNLLLILCLGHQNQSWPYLVILYFDFLTIKDSRLLSPSTSLLLGYLILVLVLVWVLLPPLIWNFQKNKISLSKLHKNFVSASVLAYLGIFLVHYFADTMLLYFSVAFWMRSPSRTSFTVF